MEVSNEGTSLYHRFLGHFRREVGGSQTLIDVCGSHTDEIRSAWPRIAAAASLQDTLVDRDQHCRYDVPVAGTHGEGLTVYELCRDPCSGVVQGICLRGIRAAGLPTELEGGFARVLLSQATTFSEATAAEPTRATRGHLAAAVHLTDLFDRTLRHSLEENEDQWRVHGRAVFLAQADFFVRRALPLELVLPAFPCKSTNGDKVASRAPDGGEELALRRLHGFVADVGKVYAPGARLWVVSDGHVFSDCSESRR